MPLLAQDARWVSLARQSAAILGAHSEAIVSAILAQWACENGADRAWPPPHNNPGNITRDVGNLDQEPHALATTPPGVGFLYSYATPEVGVAAYAHCLLNSRRYPRAIASARAGDPVGFLTHVCNAGYGTRLACCLAELPRMHLAPSSPPGSPRWRCGTLAVNVRTGPGVRFPVVGQVHRGQVVTGPEVTGAPYAVRGRVYSGWIRMAVNRFTAHAFYVKL